MSEHLDEHGQPCTRHVTSHDKLLAYAMLGSRVSSFHHESASKLQSLMMALDEIGELAGEVESDLRTAIDTAQSALRQLHGLLGTNRALAKPPQRVPTLLPVMLDRAGERQGVKVRGTVPSVDVMVAPPSMMHALALLLDLIAGLPAGGRTVHVTGESSGDRITVTLAGNAEPTHPNANELIAVAAFIIARETGTLRCAAKGFVVELPLA